MKYLINSAWMLAEQVLTIISGIFVGVYLARCIGPEKFGILSYVLALVSLLTVFSRLGMESILVRELARNKENASSYMGTAFYLMAMGALASALIMNLLVFFFENDRNIQIYVMIVSLGVVFQSFLVIDYNFQSQIKAGFSSFSRSISLIVSSIAKIILAMSDASLIYLVIAHALDYVTIALFLWVAHCVAKQPSFFNCFEKTVVRPLLSSSFPMIISGVATIALSKTDQIMIKNMLDAEKLGVYVAASKIYDGWNTLVFVLSMSILPILVHLKNHSGTFYECRLKQFFAAFLWISILFSLLVSLTADNLMSILFGARYSNGGATLAILIWASPLAAVGFVATRYLIVEGLQRKIAMRNWIAVGLNVPLNYIFIGIYGIEGAAGATLISLFVAHYVIDYLDKDLKHLAKIKNAAFFLRLRTERSLDE